MNFKIKTIYSYLPSRVETLDYLCKKNKDWDSKQIFLRTGIKKKRVIKKNQTIKNLILGLKSKYNIKELKECGLIILVTQTPHYTIPSNAHYFQKIFRMKQSSIAFDVNQGCSGYVYGLAIAESLLQKFKINKGALITCDTYSKYIGLNNRTCRTVFGDALTLTIIEKSNKKHFIDFKLGSDASGFDNFKLNLGEINMNGSEMYNFTRQAITKEVENILIINKLKIKDIKFFVFHQASKLILETLQKNLGIPKKNFYNNIINFGNTTSSSIPLAIKELKKLKKIKKGDLLLLSGFGVGYSWGSCIYKY